MPPEGSLRDRHADRPGLIETLRGEADGALVRLERHLGRLARSARELGIPFVPEEARRALAQAAAAGEGSQRLRLHLDPSGTLSVTAAPFVLQPSSTVWRLAVSSTRLDARDPLRRHKSDRRAIYEEARRGFDPAEWGEVLLLNERNEVAEGTITNVFADLGDGVLLTPPLASGCLPGILREELMDGGEAREAILLPQDLARARALHVGNSLRGLIAARL